MITRPLLAYNKTVSPEQINYPVLCSPKLDGFRNLMIDGKPLSRSFKPVANRHVSSILTAMNLPELDGELMLNSTTNFSSVQSAFTSFGGKPDFSYHVFDYFKNPNDPYEKRRADLAELLKKFDTSSIIKLVPQQLICSADKLVEFYEYCISLGYEGIIIRDPKGKYKSGRSTLNQGIMLKLKPEEDAEAEVIDFAELMTNENEPELDAFGKQVRNKQQDGMYGANTLGALVCRMPDGTTFKIGSGFDMATRKQVWDNRLAYVGKLVTYKYQELTPYGKPRFPVFKGFRSKDDL